MSDGPDKLHLEGKRVTNATMSDGRTVTREDHWQDPTIRSAVLEQDQQWTGTTVFFRKARFPQLLEDDLVDTANSAKALTTPPQPTEAERELHNLTHLPFRSWCKICQQARGRKDYKHRQVFDSRPTIQVDYCFLVSEETQKKSTVLTACDCATGMTMSAVVEEKG